MNIEQRLQQVGRAIEEAHASDETSPSEVDNILDFAVDTRPSGLALLLEGPVPTHDLPMPADQRGGLHDQDGIEELLLLHAQASEQQREAFSPHEPWTLAQLALEDEHLLSESEDLAVSIIKCKTAHGGGKGRGN